MTFDLSNPDRTIHVGVILTGGITEILDVAPIDLLHGMSPKFVKDFFFPDHIKAQALDFAYHYVTEKGEKARMTSGMTLEATDSFKTCPPLDIVLMGATIIDYTPNEAELDFMRKSYQQSSAFITICGGFQNALVSGLLKGKTATAPRFILPQLRKDSPETKWVEKRWAQDGKMWTSGTLLNGLDLMREFMIQTWPTRLELINSMLEIACCPVRDVDYEATNGHA